MMNKNLLRLLLLWTASLMYYNAVECLIVVDTLVHRYNYHHPHMDLTVAFVLYPVVAYLGCIVNKVRSKGVYYSVLSAICLAYSSVVIFFNLSYFPFKTWLVLLVFISSFLAYVWIDGRNSRAISNTKCPSPSMVANTLISLLIVIAIVCSALGHAYLVM